MRRSFILMSFLAATVAVLGACDPKTNTPVNNKPASTPAPVSTASPTASPAASPAKPGASPEVKKTDGGNVAKDAKPTATATPKAQ